MSDQSPKKYKQYLGSRSSDDLTDYARRKIKRYRLDRAVERAACGDDDNEHLQETANTEAATRDAKECNLRLESMNLNEDSLLHENMLIEEEQMLYNETINDEVANIDIVADNVFEPNQLLRLSKTMENLNLHAQTDTDPECPVEMQQEFPYEFFETENNSWKAGKMNNLNDILGSDGFFEVIKTAVTISPGELLLMILKFCVKNHLPHSVMSNLMSLFNAAFEEPVLPESRYILDKLFNSENEAVFHGVCPECTGYMGIMDELDSNSQCALCKKKFDFSGPSCNNFFVIIDPSVAIREILQAHDGYYDEVVTARRSNEKSVKDIYDGKLYRKFVRELPDADKCRYVTTILNTDGAPAFKSCQYSIWPIYLMLNEISPQDRFNNLITCGLWFNKEKPNMPVFLNPFVAKMQELGSKGITCKIKGEDRVIKPYTLVCCVDTIARAPTQGMKQFNGRCSCNWCLHPGKSHGGSMRYLLRKNTKLRDAQSTINDMKKSVEDPTYKPISGVKHVSPLIKLDYFDIIEGFVPDYMHCCLAGVGKQITNLLIKPTDVDFYHDLLTKIKVPHQITRLTRPLSDRNYWKCREWKNWILYYSIPLLSLRLENHLLKYWSLFVESLYILLKNEITHDELKKANKMLYEFVFYTQKYFGPTAMTFNVHQLLHLTTSVVNWGPLWAHSAFAFENGNDHILQAIKCARGVICQILRYINVNRSIALLEKRVFQDSSEAVRSYCSRTMTTRVKKCVKLSNITYFGQGMPIDEEVRAQLNISVLSRSYIRMVKDGCLYASCLKINVRSDNSVAQLSDGQFIQIETFIVDRVGEKEWTAGHMIRHRDHDLTDKYNALRQIINIDNEMIFVPTQEIQTVCLLMEIEEKRYVCPLPNLYFY